MICNNCGKELVEGAKFCVYCGQNRSNGTIDIKSESQNYTSHEYKTLGGWLSAITWFFLICIIVIVLIDLYSGYKILTAISDYYGNDGSYLFNSEQRRKVFIHFIIVLVSQIPYLVFLFRTHTQIRQKDYDFLKNFEISTILMCATYIIQIISNNKLVDSLGGESYNSKFILQLIIGVVLNVAILFYFIISIRVRTYFETGKYIKKSIFFSRFKIPVPSVPDAYYYENQGGAYAYNNVHSTNAGAAGSSYTGDNSFDNSNDRTSLEDLQKLKEYKALFDDGVITQEEFDRKKKQILGD